jgi:hypothetical protein
MLNQYFELRPGSDSNEILWRTFKKIVARLSQLLKQNSENVMNDEVIRTDGSEQHPANADSPSLETLQPDSNLKSDRLSQFAKHEMGIASRNEGIQMD